MSKSVLKRLIFPIVLTCLGIPVLAQQTQPPAKAADDIFAGWSPDGKQIAFLSTRDGSSFDVYVVNVDGSQERNLSNSPTEDRDPVWSPDGKRIAFTSRRDGNAEIYVVDVASGALVNLTHNPGEDGTPAWSPDGGQILFSSDRGGAYQYYVMQADGSQVRVLSTVYGGYASPQWSPDGQYIAYLADDPERPIPQLLVINVADGQVQNLLEPYWFYNKNCCYSVLAWSRNSQNVVFALPNDGNVYIASVETHSIRSLAYVGGAVAALDWHEDSQNLYIQYFQNADAFLPGLIGTDRVSLPDGYHEHQSDNPVYVSPNERYSATVVGVPSQCCQSVVVGNRDNSGQHTTISNIYNVLDHPTWSPTSEWVANTLCIDGDADVYIINPTSGKTLNLTPNDYLIGAEPPKGTFCYGAG